MATPHRNGSGAGAKSLFVELGDTACDDNGARLSMRARCGDPVFHEFLTVHRCRGQALAMSSEEPPVKRKLPLIKLSIAFVALAVAGFLVLRGLDYHTLTGRGMALIRSAGPWSFYAGIVVLPSVGAPLSIFTLVAGEAFAAKMTMAGVIAAVLVAVARNLALTYWLARYALRPVLSRLAAHYGYKIPRVTGANALAITLVLRLTPGPPFFVQSYILGLAEVPFRLYMIASWLCVLPTVVAFIILGKGIFNGNLQMVLYGVGVVVVVSVILHVVRKRYARNN
jgi:uncharacterized membrane protein YdjX (TVP38/TMEM64 family)